MSLKESHNTDDKGEGGGVNPHGQPDHKIHSSFWWVLSSVVGESAEYTHLIIAHADTQDDVKVHIIYGKNGKMQGRFAKY